MAAKTSSHHPRLDLRSGARRRWLGAFVVGAISLGALTLSVVAAIAFFRHSQPRTYRVHLATDVTPLRIFLAEQIRAEGPRHHLDLVLSSKRYGALEALAEVDSPSEFKLALIPGGITAHEYPSVRLVTTLTKEPLQVLVRPELAEKGISALRGKRVNLGPPTTASHHLAREILAFVGLEPSTEPGSGGYILESTSPDELYGELGRIESLGVPDRAQAVKTLPDAVVLLAPLPSQLARRLVMGFSYQLLPVPFAEAFCLDRLNPPTPEGVRVDRSLLTPGVIPPDTYSSDPPVPAKECPTICAPLLLVAQEDTDSEAVVRLLEAIYDSPLTSAIRPPSLRDQVHPFPLHPGTERYLRRNEPLLTPEVASNIGKLAGGIGAFASGLIALYTFLRLRKLNRFESYYPGKKEAHKPEAPAKALRWRFRLVGDDLSCRGNIIARLVVSS